MFRFAERWGEEDYVWRMGKALARVSNSLSTLAREREGTQRRTWRFARIFCQPGSGSSFISNWVRSMFAELEKMRGAHFISFWREKKNKRRARKQKTAKWSVPISNSMPTQRELRKNENFISKRNSDFSKKKKLIRIIIYEVSIKNNDWKKVSSFSRNSRWNW